MAETLSNDTIYGYIQNKEAEFDQPITINGWSWGFKDHIKKGFYYKHGRLLEGNADQDPVKNITRPLLNLQYRAEDIDVKDILLYVDDPSDYHLSFLVKKYHDDVFIVENDLDEFIDDENESTVDNGVAVVERVAGSRPEVRDLQQIAFCDQTNIEKGPIGFKFFYNPAELKEFEKRGWGNEANGATISMDDLITYAESAKRQDKDGADSETTGDYIEVYVVHGVLPKAYADDSGDYQKYTRQMHVVAFYKSQEPDNKTGVTLFRKEVTENPIKVRLRDKVFSRCAGFGGVEEVEQAQVWTNNDVIRLNDMLESASKTILKSVGADLKSRYPNGLKDMDNLQIVELNEGEDIGQVDTFPRNINLFDNDIARWEEYAQTIASAQDPLLGKQAPSGTPFRAQERQVIEGKGIHVYRQGKHAKWLEMVYNDWIIPDIQKKIVSGVKFLSSLNTDEMQYVTERITDNRVNEFVKEKILDGQTLTEEEVEAFKESTREEIIKGGNKQFLEIVKDEFKKKPLRVKINVAGKQKDLSLLTDKVVNIFRQIISNPAGFQELMQIPEMAKSFNSILEFSGLSPVNYAGLTKPRTALPAAQTQGITPEIESQTLSASVTE